MGTGVMLSAPNPSGTLGSSAPLWAQQPQVCQVPEAPPPLTSQVWECRARRGWARRRLTAEPGHCSPGAETCRAQHRSTWAPRPSAGGVWEAVGELWVSDGRVMHSSSHLLALTLLPGSWEVEHNAPGSRIRRSQPLLPAVLTHPRGDWARMERGVLHCLLPPETAHLWGNRSGGNRHSVSGRSSNTPASCAYSPCSHPPMGQ